MSTLRSFTFKKAKNYFHQAHQAQIEGQYMQAVRLYRISIDWKPSAEAHTFLGWTYSFLGDLDAAIAECEEAIALDPSFANAYNDIGAYLIAQGQHDKAYPYLKDALNSATYRASHYAHFNLGRVYQHRGDILNAYRHYRQAMALQPNYLIAQHAIERLKQECLASSDRSSSGNVAFVPTSA